MILHSYATPYKKKYQLIRHIVWYSTETGYDIIDTFDYKAEAYQEMGYHEHGDYLDREEGALPSYIEYEYEVRVIRIPIYEEAKTYDKRY